MATYRRLYEGGEGNGGGKGWKGSGQAPIFLPTTAPATPQRKGQFGVSVHVGNVLLKRYSPGGSGDASARCQWCSDLSGEWSTVERPSTRTTEPRNCMTFDSFRPALESHPFGDPSAW